MPSDPYGLFAADNDDRAHWALQALLKHRALTRTDVPLFYPSHAEALDDPDDFQEVVTDLLVDLHHLFDRRGRSASTLEAIFNGAKELYEEEVADAEEAAEQRDLKLQNTNET